MAGLLSDRMGAKLFTVGGPLLSAVSFLVLIYLPVNFSYWSFALLIALNGFGAGLFSAPNRAEMMNAVPADARGAASGMIATFMNAASVLSIGVFFSLMVAGLAGSPAARACSAASPRRACRPGAAQIAGLPPIGVLFASFLGYNPMQELLGAATRRTCPPAHATFLTGRQFFPDLISGPFHDGLGVAFGFALGACVPGRDLLGADRPPGTAAGARVPRIGTGGVRAPRPASRANW